MFRSNLLENKRILITGGGTGLGKAAAHRFLELGATVYICGRRPEVLAATVAELRQASGGAAHSLVCDVRDAARVEEMIATIWRDGALDGLMNNAAGNFLARTEDLSLRAFEAVLGIVLQGSLHTTLACGKRWLAAGHKAVEWGNRGIRMNAIAPGPIPTEGAFSRLLPRPDLEDTAKKRVPLGRFGTLEEFANLAAFLVSDGSGYINGDVITMDGGEWLQGAGEFTALGRMLSEKEWAMMKPKKASG